MDFRISEEPIYICEYKNYRRKNKFNYKEKKYFEKSISNNKNKRCFEKNTNKNIRYLRKIIYNNKTKTYIRIIKNTNKEVIKKLDILISILERKYNNIEKHKNKKQFLLGNLIAGITKGLGTGIGFTVFTGLIIYILQYIIRLNIPIIGEYISDIVDIVKK